MTTLVYVGVNEGESLREYIDLYDEIHAFEPDSEIFSKLTQKFIQYKNVNFVNSACSDKPGTKKLYVTENRHSTSLSELSEFSIQNGFSGGKLSYKTFEVDVINLNDYLRKNNIEYIDTLITDCQGSDYLILTTIKEYIDNRKIGEIFCETHADGVTLYEGLNNQYQEFVGILSENYYVKDFYLDGKIVPKNTPPYVEWDTHWKLK